MTSFLLWPDIAYGHRRRIIPFSPCVGCGAGTWVAYDAPRCRACAKEPTADA